MAGDRSDLLAPAAPDAGRLTPAELERRLGDPWREEGVLPVPAVLAAAEQGELVWPALSTLAGWGLPAALVPAAAGGGMRSVADSFGLLRVVARRDPQLAVGYGSTFLGAVPVWLFGSPDQQRWLAGRVTAGEFGACAISEREHGSDLARTGFRADRQAGTYRLTGQKWPVGNARRGTFVTLLAGTGGHTCSLLLLDKAQLPADGWQELPRAATLGLTGHDLSGLSFQDCPVPASTVLGTGGTGLAQILKTLQVTRPLVSGISLGALDSALRLTIGYARERRLYGWPLTGHPVIREILLRAYLTLLVGECVAVPVARALSAAPERLHRWSAVTKYLVPVLVEQALAELATVLSARYYIQDEPLSRGFAKLQRDHAAMSIFDGTTHVSLAAVAGSAAGALEPTTGPEADRLRAGLFGWDRPAPAWQPAGDRLRLAGHGPDEILGGWTGAVTAAEDHAGTGPAGRDLLAELESWHSLRARYQAATEADGTARAAADGPPPARALRLARVHCLLHAAASCLHAWRYGRDRWPEPFAGAGWLVPALQRLRQELDGEQELAPAHLPELDQAMYEQFDRGTSFSLDPYPLGH